MNTSQQQEPSGAEDANGSDDEKDLSPEEKRVLERKMKKILKKEEKKRLKEEGKSIKKVKVQSNLAEKKALEYLAWWDKHSYVSQVYQRLSNSVLMDLLHVCVLVQLVWETGGVEVLQKQANMVTAAHVWHHKGTRNFLIIVDLYSLHTYYSNKTWTFVLILCFKSCIWFLFLYQKITFIVSFNCFHCICMHFSLYFRWLTIISKCC